MKSESSAGNSKNPQNFQISCRFFIFLAEHLVFSQEIWFSSRFFNFPAEFLNFRRNVSRSAGNLDLRLEILFSIGFFKFPADFLFFQQKIWICRWKIYFPEGFLNFRLNISHSAGNLDFLLEVLLSSGFFKFPEGFLDFQRNRFCTAGTSQVSKKGESDRFASVRFP